MHDPEAREVVEKGSPMDMMGGDRSLGSTAAHSMTSTTPELIPDGEDGLIPTTQDIKRLERLQSEQERRLKLLNARAGRLQAQERTAWKGVNITQQMALQAQEVHCRRQVKEVERLRNERDLINHEQILRERAYEMRMRGLEEAPRLQKFEENQEIGRRQREESKQLEAALRNHRERILQTKAMQAEVQRQQRRQQKLRRELEESRREQARKDANLLRYNELRQRLQRTEAEVAAAERSELDTVERLQYSQTIRAEVISQWQDMDPSPSSPVRDGQGYHGPERDTYAWADDVESPTAAAPPSAWQGPSRSLSPPSVAWSPARNIRQAPPGRSPGAAARAVRHEGTCNGLRSLIQTRQQMASRATQQQNAVSLGQIHEDEAPAREGH